MLSSDGEGTGAARVGAELRAARHRLGWDLPGVSAALRIRQSYLEAIEDGRVADLPGAAYAVGFVRTYATALGLDADEVSRRFRAEAHEVNRKTQLAFPAPVPERGVPAMAVVLVGLLVAGGTYVAWYRLGNDRAPRVEAVQPVPERLTPLAERAAPPSNPSPQVASILPQPPPAPVVAAPAGPSPPSATPSQAAAATSAARPVPMPPGSPAPAVPPPVVPVVAPAPPAPAVPQPPEARVVVRAKTDSWMQVRERQGQVLLNRVLRSGETWPVPDKPQLLLTTGNAGGTELLVDGKPGPSLGQAGAVRRDVPLDADALKQGRTTATQ